MWLLSVWLKLPSILNYNDLKIITVGILKLWFKTTWKNMMKQWGFFTEKCFQNKCLLLINNATLSSFVLRRLSWAQLLSTVCTCAHKSENRMTTLPPTHGDAILWFHWHGHKKPHTITQCRLVDAKPKWQFICVTRMSHDMRSIRILSGDCTVAKKVKVHCVSDPHYHHHLACLA